MVVRVLEAGLEGVVVDVRHAPLRLHLPDPHRFKFDVGHGAGRVLGQGLIDLQPDLAPLLERAVHRMRFQDFFRQSESHVPLFLQCDV